MKREVRLLLERAVDGLILAIEHFNRPFDRGRNESTLILLNHSFEMFLKAAILHRGGRIKKRREGQTIGFDKCVNTSLLEPKVKFLSPEQATTLRIVNGMRDAAEHHLVELSENELYAYVQSGVTLFGDALHEVFGRSLTDFLPTRVLPVSTSPPKNLHFVIDEKFDLVKELLRPGRRSRLRVRATLRSLALVDYAVRENPNQPTDLELDEIAKSAAAGRPWQEIFPGVASINFETEGTGLTVKLRITKLEGFPVRLVHEGEEGTVVAVKRVDELSYYSLGLKDLAAKVGLTMNRTIAVVRFLKLQEDPAFFKEIVIGKSRFKRYSPPAMKKIMEALPGLDMAKVWGQFGPHLRKARAP